MRREACILADVSAILTSVSERPKISVCGNMLLRAFCVPVLLPCLQLYALHSTEYTLSFMRISTRETHACISPLIEYLVLYLYGRAYSYSYMYFRSARAALRARLDSRQSTFRWLCNYKILYPFPPAMLFRGEICYVRRAICSSNGTSRSVLSFSCTRILVFLMYKYSAVH